MLSPEARKIRNTLKKDQPITVAELEQARSSWEDHAKSIPLPASVSVEKVELAGRPCLFVVPDSADTMTGLFYLHGGGLMSGSPYTHLELASRIALVTGQSVLLVSYRLAPEYAYPCALSDALSVMDLVINQPNWPDNWVVMGDSSGAGLALSSLLSSQKHQSKLKGFIGLSGVYDQTLQDKRLVELDKRDPFVSLEVLKQCRDWYIGEHDPSIPGISPLFADLSRLPPCLLLVGSEEVLLADSENLYARLIKQGTEHELQVYEGLWHTWLSYGDFPEARQALASIKQFLQGL